MKYIHIVTYSDWDDFRTDSVWFDADLAWARAEELNKAAGRNSYWEVDEIELGDPQK